MSIAERRIEREESSQSDSSAHDRILLNAIETLADIPDLADRLHEALAGECSLLFDEQIGARLKRSVLSTSDADRVHRVMEALATATSWWPSARQRVQSPADLAALAMPLLARRDHEELHVAVVDGRNGLLALRQVYVGTATGTSVRIAELLRPVLDLGGVGFALVHNHPSGDPEPSEEDVRLTAEVVAAARLLDLELLDHLVIGHGRWSSIRSQRPSVWATGGLPE